MKYNWLHSKVEEHTKKILKELGHQGLIMVMEVYIITVIEYIMY